MTTCFGLYFS